MSESISIRSVSANGTTGLALSGDFTIYVACEVHAAIGAALDAGEDIRLDLSGVGEFDTSALQILRAAGREAGARGISLTLTGHPPALLETMTLLSLGPALDDESPREAA